MTLRISANHWPNEPPSPLRFSCARIWVPSARCLSSHRAGRSQAQASFRRPRQLVAPGGPWKLEAAMSCFLARFARGGAPRADATGVARREKGEGGKRAGSRPVTSLGARRILSSAQLRGRPGGPRPDPAGENAVCSGGAGGIGLSHSSPHRARWPTGWIRLPRGRRMPRPAANATSGRSFPRDFAPDSTYGSPAFFQYLWDVQIFFIPLPGYKCREGARNGAQRV